MFIPETEYPRPRPLALTPIIFLTGAARAEIADLRDGCHYMPVRAPAVQERLARLERLLTELERHGEK